MHNSIVLNYTRTAHPNPQNTSASCKHTSKHATDRHHITANRHENAAVLPPLLPHRCGNCPSFPTLEDPHTSRGLMGSRKAYCAFPAPTSTTAIATYPINSKSRPPSSRHFSSTAITRARLDWALHAGMVKELGGLEDLARKDRAQGMASWRARRERERSECAAYLRLSCRVFETLVSTLPMLKRTVLKRPETKK